MKKQEHLTKSVAVTSTAYQTLCKMSQLTGIGLGQLTTNAIERAFDPAKNPQLASAVASAKSQITASIT